MKTMADTPLISAGGTGKRTRGEEDPPRHSEPHRDVANKGTAQSSI